MYVKEITYSDFNGLERTEKILFNLTKSELLSMELSGVGSLIESLDTIVKAKSKHEIMKQFRELIRKSYGVKSPDGKHFIKSEELSDEFENSAAYDVFFMELITDDEAAAKFVNGILPKDLLNEAKKQNVTALPSSTNA